MMSESYKKLMEQGKIDKETAEKEIRIYEFLATCDVDDFCQMVDSSAFNDIIKAYLCMAVNNAKLLRNRRTRLKGNCIGYLMKNQQKRCWIVIDLFFL